MILIEEKDSPINGHYFERSLVDSNGHKTLLEKVSIWSVKIVYETVDYYYLYNSKREVINDVFNFLNIHLLNEPNNTRMSYLNDLKYFFSFLELFKVDYNDITIKDIKKFKDFLHGKSRIGITISTDLLTKREADTINHHLSVCRKLYTFLEMKDSPFHKKDISIRKGDKGFKAHAQKQENFTYSENERSQRRNIKVPKYIKISELNKILLHIRAGYTLREEIVVRLMFECGLRIGEVLGLTLEDLETSPNDIKYKPIEELGSIILRNRQSDKYYQLAKSCMNITKKEDYLAERYYEDGVGYQKVYPTIALLRRIEQYIEETTGVMSPQRRQNYEKNAVADKVTDGENLDSKDNYYLIINKNGTNLGIGGWNKVIRRIFLECGLKVDVKVRKHNLNHRFRHGYAMFLKRYQKASPTDLMYALRHADLSNVLVYSKPDDDEMYEANKSATESMYNMLPNLRY